MKRRLALFMTAVLVLGTGISSYAAEPAVLWGNRGSVVLCSEETGQTAAGSAGTGTAAGTEATPGTEAGTGTEATTGTEAGTGTDAGAGAGTTTGTGAAAGTDGSAETGADAGTGEETGSGDADSQTTQGQPGTDAQPESGNPAQPSGQVDVFIGAALILEKNMTFRVSLEDAGGKACGDDRFIVIGREGKANSDEPDTGIVRFPGLAQGKYTLRVSAQGFATYTQEISVKGRERVELMTGFLGYAEDRYKAGISHPGVLLIGDVNGDGIVNEGDRNALMEAMEGEGIASNPRADLNGDGQVDLIDLEYLTKGFQKDRDILAFVESSISPAAMKLNAGNGTRVQEGSLEELLLSDAPVTLKPGAEGAISESNPVALEFDVDAAGEAGLADGIVLGLKDTDVTAFRVTYEDTDGTQGEAEFPAGQEEARNQAEPSVEEGIYLLAQDGKVTARLDKNGNIEVNLGRQVAIKRVTITITAAMRKDGAPADLATISKVEFVNGMEKRIPEPEPDSPTGLEGIAGNRRISLSWNPCVNITGYEVEITKPDSGFEPEYVMVRGEALEITSFHGSELANNQEYRARVRSVNGTWRSAYSNEAAVTPKPSGKPDKPENVSTAGRYQSIAVSWKGGKDTESYNLYYKKSSEEAFQKIEGITGKNYTITGLADSTEYKIYVTGVNEFGESGPSSTVAATTIDSYPAVMPKYRLINVGEKGAVGAHIVGASMNGGSMNGSSLDTQAGTAWGTVDKDAASYYYKGTWDDGGFNPMGLNHGLTYEFDQAYEIDTIAFHDNTSRDTGYSYAKIRCWDKDGNKILDGASVSLSQKSDAGGRVYYVVKLPRAVAAKKIQLGLARYSASGSIAVSEVYFYYYDSLLEEILGLYEDDLHTVLRADVTQKTIDALRTRLGTADPVSGEYHPEREMLERELTTAEQILKDGGLQASVQIHNGITTKDENRGFGGLNAWQPLGVSAAAGEEIVVYVGHNGKKTGESTDLQLVATQYHGEWTAVGTNAGALKVGPNKITVPKISSLDVESGGALYVQYTGNGNAADRYAVRVSGGAQVPKLDLYRVTDGTERLNRAKAYVEALDGFVGQMAQKHAQIHQSYAYDEVNCILGASDILLDTMMLSLPAKQVLAGAGTGTVEERARRLLTSMDAVEDEMYLFYQHKGLNASAPEVRNQIPKGHLNIRYQRMFTGAFMYAAGNHIGIEWGSAPGLIGSPGLQAGSDGSYQSGRFFGWGIAHEIGHCINQGSYAVPEVTNNYYAVLAQAKDTNGTVRFQYDQVYKKVTSGTKGPASNVFTRLGMYWQLHLAYDKGYNYKTYENYEEQLANLFFARVDTYARNTAKAPSPGGVGLVLDGDGDQKLMRLSCAAAGKNLLEFFERWGMTPNEDTRAYAAQFEKEARAIYYVCDDSRAYTLRGGTSALGTEGKVEAVADTSTAVVNAADPNQVDITVGAKNIPAGDVLGYEIVRCMYSGGRVQRETAGFTTTGSFSDRLYVNNRAVWYEITLIDQYLNRSAVKTLNSVKIQNDGSMDKSFWTVSTKGLTAVGVPVFNGSEEEPCPPESDNMAARVIDGDMSTVYTATADGAAEIVLEFNKKLTVAGFKYQTGVGMDGNYTVQVLLDGIWTEAASGSFTGKQSDTVYFANADKKYVSTYAATAVKLSFGGPSGQVSIAELDVLGVTGDNVDFRRAEGGAAAIGRLAEDYRYGNGAEDVIPRGAIVFTGSYKGNPAYNAVMLYDQNGDVVGGTDASGNLKAQYIILADVPDQGAIQNVTDGTWIYWIENPGQDALVGVSKVRAELYRVNNAQTNEGQRLVSDSLFEDVPAQLPEIRLSGGSVPEQ